MEKFEKIIWQTHKWEYDDLPELYKQTTKTWQVMNPDWEYRYIPNSQMRDEVKKVSTKYNILQKFDFQQGMMEKSDIYREAMVYEYGGLWADMDAICLFPIDRVVEKNLDKDMICSPPMTKFGFDENNVYLDEPIKKSINKIILGQECSYWIPNGMFLGKKHNRISEEIMKILTSKDFSGTDSCMDLRAPLYEKYHKYMSLDLICVLHDAKFNVNTYNN